MSTNRLDVTTDLVRSLVREVAPLVERLTGWQLEIDGLVVRVLPRERGYEEIVLRRMAAVGIPVDEEAPRGLFGRVVEYLLEHNVAGVYEPSRSELMLVRENVDDSNLDGLRVVVVHELVHRGQHLSHPELGEEVDVVIREAFDAMSGQGAGLAAIGEKLKRVQSIMTLLESHAVYVHEQLRRTRFPKAEIETPHGLTAVLFRFLSGAKAAQYRNGIPEVAAAAAAGKVDALYARMKSA